MRITVIRATPKGLRNIHTFEYGPGLWIIHQALSHDERRMLSGDTWVRPASRRPLSAASTSPRLMDHRVIDFGNGVRISTAVLTVVLDALRRVDRRRVDVSDVKAVESQLGRQIGNLASLPVKDRQHAEDALYAAIVNRCSTV
jgi:hypothetical protein